MPGPRNGTVPRASEERTGGAYACARCHTRGWSIIPDSVEPADADLSDYAGFPDGSGASYRVSGRHKRGWITDKITYVVRFGPTPRPALSGTFQEDDGELGW